jgi:putative redox protein
MQASARIGAAWKKGHAMAGRAYIQWISKGRYIGTDSSKHSVVISTQDEENAVGMKPSDLLLVALGSCSCVDIVNILKKKRQDLVDLEVEVTGDQDADPPWAFNKIQILYTVRGRGLSEKAVTDAIRLSEDKYCSVKATLAKAVEIHSEIRIVQES